MKTFNLFLLAIVLTITSVPASAEARRDGDAADPLRRAQYMIRQLSQEKSQLEAETARLNAEVQSLTSQIESLEGQVDKTSGKLDQSQQRNDQLIARIKGDVEKYKQLMAKYQEAVTMLRAANSDNAHLVQAVEERNQWIDQCRAKNTSMYEANMELLDRYQNKSAWKALAQREPVTGIASVELENEIQEYQFRLEDLQMYRFKPSENHEDYVRTSQTEATVSK